MEIGIEVLVTIVVSIFGMCCTYKAGQKEDKKDYQEEATKNAMIESDIKHIKSYMETIQRDVSETKGTVVSYNERFVRIELKQEQDSKEIVELKGSMRAYHKRLDKIQPNWRDEDE